MLNRGPHIMDIESLLRASAENMASDIHVRAGGPPYLRVDGDLIPVDVGPLTPEDSERLAFGRHAFVLIRREDTPNQKTFGALAGNDSGPMFAALVNQRPGIETQLGLVL